MFSNETIRKLREIHMGVMAEQLSAQLEDPQFRNVPFEDRRSDTLCIMELHRKMECAGKQPAHWPDQEGQLCRYTGQRGEY